MSHVATGVVTLDGLTPLGVYDFVLYSSQGGVPSFTMNGQTKTITPSGDWASLTENTHYVLFQGVAANGSGQLEFTPNENSGITSTFSAFQLQTAAGVPEPSASLLVLGGLAGLALVKRQCATDRE